MRWRCRTYRVLLVDGADRTLSDRQQERLERHLARCSACAEELTALREVPAVLKTSAVPDPGEEFWRQQRDAIGRATRALPEPSRAWRPTLWFAGVQHSTWRYPLAATAAGLVVMLVYQFAERPQRLAQSGVGQSAVAALDTESLAALHQFMESLAPSDEPLSQPSADEETVLAALPLEDIMGVGASLEAPQAMDLTEDELEGIGSLVGGVG